MHEVPTSPDICASTILWNLKREIETSTHVLMNHWIATNTTGKILSDYSLYAGTMDASLSCCLMNHTVFLWLVLLALHQLFNRSNVINRACTVRSSAAWNSFRLPSRIYQLLKASSQVRCVSNFSVEILETFVNCLKLLINCLSCAVNTELKR